MDMLKRWSNSSSIFSSSSDRPRTPDRPPSSPGIFSRFKKSPGLPRSDTGLSDIGVPRDVTKPCNPRTEWKSLPPARAQAARKRIDKMKDMLRSTYTRSKRSSAQSRTSALIQLYLDRDFTAELEELGTRDAPSVAEPSDPGGDQITKSIDELLTGDFPSPTSSELEGSTFLEGKPEVKRDSDAESASSVYSVESGPTGLAKTSPESDTLKSLDGAESTVLNPLETFCQDYSEESVSDLPPPAEDILNICLTPIRYPVIRKNDTRPLAVCQVCSQMLLRPLKACEKHRAWMIHSGAKSEVHYLHVECLRDAKKVWEGGTGSGECRKCDAFRRIVQGMDGEGFQGRVGRVEKLVFAS